MGVRWWYLQKGHEPSVFGREPLIIKEKTLRKRKSNQGKKDLICSDCDKTRTKPRLIPNHRPVYRIGRTIGKQRL